MPDADIATLMKQASARALYNINSGAHHVSPDHVPTGYHTGTADCRWCVASIATEFRERLRDTLSNGQYEAACEEFFSAFSRR